MDVLLMTFLWAQRKLYEAFLKSELVHLAVQPKGSPLAAITVRSPFFFFIVILFTFLCQHDFYSFRVLGMFIGGIMFHNCFILSADIEENMRSPTAID